MADKSGQFSDIEREAMRARSKELAAEAKSARTRDAGEKEVQAALAQMFGTDAVLGKRIHELVSQTAPELMPKTWYGMPAYANKEGKVICFFKAAGKYEARYATFGFNDAAMIDDGNMWATSFGLVKLTAVEEKQIVELVKKAAA